MEAPLEGPRVSSIFPLQLDSSEGIKSRDLTSPRRVQERLQATQSSACARGWPVRRL